jgi:RNA polymerase sigma factor (sigma-70 family)
MTASPFQRVVEHARRAALVQAGSVLQDADLMARFIDRGDEAAFELLMRRHGPMVLGVCGRILQNCHDAEDAFQATFLVLVRKAASITPRIMVGNWLYGVARTTALRAKAAASKRRAKESAVLPCPCPSSASSELWTDLLPLLDGELARLPEKYRAPILLCDLESATIRNAAKQLGWPLGTVAGRLARGRKLLARRLARHGVVCSGGLLATLIGQHACAAVPARLVAATVIGVSRYAPACAALAGIPSLRVQALAEGVCKFMFISKLRKGAALTMACLLGLGVGIDAYSSSAAQPMNQLGGAALAQSDDRKEIDPKSDLQAQAITRTKQFQVNLRVMDLTENGQKKLIAEPKLVTVEGKEASFICGGEVWGAWDGKESEFLHHGFRINVLVSGRSDDDRLRLQCSIENSVVEKISDDEFQVNSRKKGIMKIVALGDKVEICTLKDVDGKQYCASVEIAVQQDITTTTRVPKKKVDEE